MTQVPLVPLGTLRALVWLTLGQTSILNTGVFFARAPLHRAVVLAQSAFPNRTLADLSNLATYSV